MDLFNDISNNNNAGASHALVSSQILQLRGQQLTDFVTMLSNYRNNIDENSTSSHDIGKLETALQELRELVSDIDRKILEMRNRTVENTNTQGNIDITVQELQSVRNAVILYKNKPKINKIKWNLSSNNKVSELYLQSNKPNELPCHYYSNPPIFTNYEDIGCTKMSHNFTGESVLDDDEWIIRIDRINISEDNSTLSDGFIFYTSQNNTIKVPSDLDMTNTNQSIEKVFRVDCTLKHWYEHYRDLAANNKSLAVISNAQENQLAWLALKNSGCRWNGERNRPGVERGGPGMALGGIRTGCNDPSQPCTGFKNNNWKWIDDTTWNWTNWSNGEPNNARHRRSGEPYLMMWDYYDNVFPEGTWNDIFVNHSGWKMPAIYQEYINNYQVDNINTTGSTQIVAIKDINAPDMIAEIDNRKDTDSTLKDNLDNAIASALNIIDDYKMDNNNFNTSIIYYETLKRNALETIPRLESDICSKTQLNIAATNLENTNLTSDQQHALPTLPTYCPRNSSVQGFTNLYTSNILNNNPISNFMNNFLYGNNINEGMTNRNFPENPYYNYMTGLISNSQREAQEEARTINAAEYNENLNYAQELISQKENVLSDVLMDYMINKDKGSSAEKVYEKLKSDNNTKLRKIQINEYTTNIYREYISILKFIILLSVLTIPAILLNKQGFLSTNLTIIYFVILVLIGIIFTGGKLLTLHKRDNINYEKITVPYHKKFDVSGNQVGDAKKRGGLNQFGIPGLPCIGDECCGDDPNMIFQDNKCVYTELDSNGDPVTN